MFDESPKSNTCIKSDERNGNGREYAQEGLETVPCEQLDPCNCLLGKSISSIHGKSTFNVQEWQQDNVQPSPDVVCRLIAVSWLCEQAKGGEQCLDLEWWLGCASPLACSPSAGNRGVSYNELPSSLQECFEKIAHSYLVDRGNGFCVFVFDPGKLGVGQGTLNQSHWPSCVLH